MEGHRCVPEQRIAMAPAACDMLLCGLACVAETSLKGAQGRSKAGAAARGAGTFNCAMCRRDKRWAAAGLPEAPAARLPGVCCASCLAKGGRPAMACALAASCRAALKARFESLGFEVVWIEPDGWCLPASVARATDNAGGAEGTLRMALEALRDGSPLTHVADDALRAAVMRQAGQLLNRFGTTRQTSRAWTTDLGIPLGLSWCSKRPLHIFSVSIVDGMAPASTIVRTVVDATGQSKHNPILLLRACDACGYDLVRERP